MILFAAFAAIHQQAPIEVVLIGDSAAVRCAETLGSDLGATYHVTSVHSGSPNLSISNLELLKKVNPQVVIAEFGSESAVDPRWDAERDEFVPGLESLVGSLRNLASHPRVQLCTPPLAGKAADLPTRQRLSEQIIPLVKQAGRELGCSVTDLGAAIADRLDLMDGVNPSPLGAQMLAEAMDQTLATGRKSEWKVIYFDSQESDEGPAKNAIDGDTETYWHTNYSTTQEKYPHEIQVDTGSVREVGGFSYFPRQDGVNGRIANYEFYLSLDGKDWGHPVAKGRFKNEGDLSKIVFESPVRARYFRFRALSEQQGDIWASVAELDLLKFYPKRP